MWWAAAAGDWRAMPPTRCPEQEACDDECMTALPFSVIVSPVARDDRGFEDKLISFAGMASNGLGNCSERDEPETRNKLARPVLLGLARRVVSGEAEAGDRDVVLGCQLRISRKDADGC